MSELSRSRLAFALVMLPAAVGLFFGMATVTAALVGEWPALVVGVLASLGLICRALRCTITADTSTIRVRNLVHEVEIQRSAVRGPTTRGLLPWTDVPAVAVLIV